MGTPFDFFSPRSWPSDRSVSAEAQANRALLAQAMRKRGFRPYDKEWWHFTLRHEPYPETYFDFPVTVSVCHKRKARPARAGLFRAAIGRLRSRFVSRRARNNSQTDDAVPEPAPKKAGGIAAPQRLLGISVG